MAECRERLGAISDESPAQVDAYDFFFATAL